MKALAILSLLILITTCGWGQVTFYEHSNFQGAARTITSDWSYSHEPCWNDKISSIRIERGWKVVLYEHNWGGNTLTLTCDWSVERWDDYWNDRVTSIRVIPPRGQACVDDHHYLHDAFVPEGIVVHEHAGFRGVQKRLTHNVRRFNSRWWNNRVSSIQIPPGWKVIAYDHPNFRGAQMTLTSDWSTDRWSRFWNDRISSIRVIPPRRQRR